MPPPTAHWAPLCGLYVAAEKGIADSLRFESGGRVIVNTQGLEVPKRYAVDGSTVHIEGGLDAALLPDGSLKSEYGRFSRAGGDPGTCVVVSDESQMTCFDRAELVRRTGAVQASQEAHQACCNSGNLMSCAAYGTLVLVRTGNAFDATPPLTKACEAGMGAACASLAVIAEQRGDLKERRRFLDLACKGKNAEACFALGELDSQKLTPR